MRVFLPAGGGWVGPVCGFLSTAQRAQLELEEAVETAEEAAADAEAASGDEEAGAVAAAAEAAAAVEAAKESAAGANDLLAMLAE